MKSHITYKKNEFKGIELTLPNGTNDYYFEFGDIQKTYALNILASPTSLLSGSKYYYVLARITVDDVQPKEDKEITLIMEKREKENALFDTVMQEYMKKNNITDKRKLTNKDYEAINKELLKRKGVSQAKSSVNTQAIFDETMNAYMKEHGIKSTSSLTRKDMNAIMKLAMPKIVQSLPANQRKIVDKRLA